jgi:hypothetical protein
MQRCGEGGCVFFGCRACRGRKLSYMAAAVGGLVCHASGVCAHHRGWWGALFTPCGVECTPFPHVKRVWGADAQYGVAGCRALGFWLVVVLTTLPNWIRHQCYAAQGMCRLCWLHTRGRHNTIRPIYTQVLSLLTVLEDGRTLIPCCLFVQGRVNITLFGGFWVGRYWLLAGTSV